MSEDKLKKLLTTLIYMLLATAIILTYLMLQGIKRDRVVIEETVKSLNQKLEDSIAEKQAVIDQIEEQQSWERFCSMENVECFDDENDE